MQYLKKLLFLAFVLVCLNAQNAFAAADSTKYNEKINNDLLQNYQGIVSELESQRIQDSIVKSELKRELSELKMNDSAAKTALQKKLNKLSEREINRIDEKQAKIDSLRKNAHAYPRANSHFLIEKVSVVYYSDLQRIKFLYFVLSKK